MPLIIQLREDKKITGEFILIQPDVSEEEFYAFADEDIKCELINGVLVIQSPASPEHEDIFSYLNALLRLYLDETEEGKVFGSRLAMRLSSEWSPEPDILVIFPANYENLQEGRLNGPADIVFEILSKSTKEIDLQKKLPAYLEFGVKEVWIIDPQEKTLAIHTKTGSKEWGNPKSKEKVESSVLSKFFIRINWLWNREKNKVGKIIQEILRETKV